MKRYLRYGMALIAAAALLSFAACGVGEHENPEPPQAAAPMPAEQTEVYTNAAFGVTITYLSTWTATEAADGSSIAFVSADARPTRATFAFERLDPPPASLLDYLANEHPDWTLITYDTATLHGYFFDDPVAGPNGGDVREYAFLGGAGGDVLVLVHVEFFTEGRAAFLGVLDAMTIE